MKNNDFTFAVAVRGTKLELGFIESSLKSAIALNPGEFLVGIDVPTPDGLYDKIESVFKETGYTNYKIIKVDRDDSWNFQLANNIWHMYTESKYDKILSFDIDSKLRKEVLLGVDDIGKNNVAVLSFTKRLRTETISEMMRFISYRIRVRQAENPFSGIYWIHRPTFFKLVNLEDYKKIVNGIDSYLQVVIKKQDRFTIMCRKEMGCSCLDIQNEDYPWRQFQTGIWLSVNKDIPPSFRKLLDERYDGEITKELIVRCLKNPLWAIRSATKHIFITILTPKLFVIVKALMYGHYEMVRGYRWANNNPDSEAAKTANGMGYNEWSMLGSKYIDPIKNWKRHGTGY